MSEPTNVKASLGCGTLILIAFIVLVFGGHEDHKKLDGKIEALQVEVQQLREEVKAAMESKSEEEDEN